MKKKELIEIQDRDQISLIHYKYISRKFYNTATELHFIKNDVQRARAHERNPSLTE